MPTKILVGALEHPVTNWQESQPYDAGNHNQAAEDLASEVVRSIYVPRIGNVAFELEFAPLDPGTSFVTVPEGNSYVVRKSNGFHRHLAGPTETPMRSKEQSSTNQSPVSS